jgi:hypothetical protein
MKSWASLLFLPIAAAVGCGSSGSGSSSIVNPPPVQAQSGYSNSSITGTYSIVLSRGDAESDIGSFKADGNGNISSGTLSVIQGVGFPICTVSFTGTYSLQSTASGTANINTQPSNTSACAGLTSQSVSFVLQAAQSGDSVLFAANTTAMYSGSASKQ